MKEFGYREFCTCRNAVCWTEAGVVGYNSELLEERKLSSTIEWSGGEELAKVRK
jgi:hypothetical protein